MFKTWPCSRVKRTTDVEIKERPRKYKRRGIDETQDKLTGKTTLPFLASVHDTSDRWNKKYVKEMSKQETITIGTQCTRIKQRNKQNLSSFSNHRSAEELLSGSKCNRKGSFADKPRLLPPMTLRKTYPEQISKHAKRFNDFSGRPRYDTFPRYLPKIEPGPGFETRRDDEELTTKELRELPVEFNDTKPAAKRKLVPSEKRAVKPRRAALSTSATLRGLRVLSLDEQVVIRFRLSNYDIKDIDTGVLDALGGCG